MKDQIKNGECKGMSRSICGAVVVKVVSGGGVGVWGHEREDGR